MKKKYYVELGKDSRIVLISLVKQAENQFEFEFPENFNFQTVHDYKIINEELIKDPIPPITDMATMPTTQERLDALEAAVLELAEMM